MGPIDTNNHQCALCGGKERLTEHHLIPRSWQARGHQSYSKAWQVATVTLCRGCHNRVHRWISARELATRRHSVETLASHPKIARYIACKRLAQEKPHEPFSKED